MKQSAWINARLLCPVRGLDADADAQGGILVEDGIISAIGAEVQADSLSPDTQIHDCAGATLTTGLFDFRVYTGEPSSPEKEGFASAARAAAAGGVTSFAVLPDAKTGSIDDEGGLNYVARRARLERGAKIYPWATITMGARGEVLSDMGLLREGGAIGFTDGENPVEDSRLLENAMRYGTSFDLLLAGRPEDLHLAGSGVMNAGALAARLGLEGRSAVAEVAGLERDLRLVAQTGSRYHVSGVSTALAVEVLVNAKARGLRVTADTAPQYFLLTEEEVGDYRTFARLLPPLRSEADRAAIESAVGDGTIDLITSAHTPQDQESKRVPFSEAAEGMVGLETLFVTAWELVERGVCTEQELMQRLASIPAGLAGYESALKIGASADLMVYERANDTVDASQFRSRSQNTLFDGFETSVRVKQTVVDGRVVYDGS